MLALRRLSKLESIARFRDDVILRTALDETLDLFGDESKKILLYTISIGRNEKERTTVRDNEGYLNYDRIAQVMKDVFGDHASKLLLEHLDKRIAELTAAIKVGS
jgi:hypothetical protein